MNNQTNTFSIPNPPKDIFTNVSNRVLQEDQITFLMEKIEYTDGIKVFYKEAQFPRSGFPTPEAIDAINKVKRLLVNSIKLNKISLFSVFVLNKNKNLIEWFNNVAYEIMYPFIIKDEFLTKPAREIKNILSPIDEKLATILAHLVEYDDAYRYRFQDIFSEINLISYSYNPLRELGRVLNIAKDRDLQGVYNKYINIYKVLKVLSYIPAYKKKINNILLEIYLPNMRFSESDWYWVCQRGDYKFGGLTTEERFAYIESRNWTLPEPFLVTFNQ